MRTVMLFREMKRVLEGFAYNYLNCNVDFRETLNITKPSGMSEDILKMYSFNGQPLLSFVILKDRRIYQYSDKAIDIFLESEASLPIFNAFIQYACSESTDVFQLFINELTKKTKKIGIITSVELLPNEYREIEAKSRSYLIKAAKHAIITTPFENITVYKTPRFIFENDRFYLHDRFQFSSMKMDYTFQNKSEIDSSHQNDEIEKLVDEFYDDHYREITKKLHEIYDIPLDDFKKWTRKQFIEHYPVLVMERY